MNQGSTQSNRLPALYADLDRWFGDFFGANQVAPRKGTGFRPSWDIQENDKSYEIHVELPGLTQDDVHIDVQDDALVIHGEKSITRDEKEAQFHRVERRTGSFERQVRFPEVVDFEKVEAKLEHGVLAISVPKAEKEQPKRIEINVAG